MMDAPSAIALACSTCGAFVTPCLVCAYPILPFRTTTFQNVWKDCSHCGARNPIHDMLRYALGLPPALALSLPMASLAQMSFINRRDYILGMHAKSEEVEGACPLYFRECQGILMLESQPEFQKNIAARYETSEKCTNERNLLLPKHKHSADCHTSTSLKRPRSYSDECPECGASKDTYICTAPAKDLIQSDMQTQRLLCAEGLYEDLDCLSIPYPICRPNQYIARFYQKGVSVGSKRDSCRYSQKFSNISLELLKVANSALLAHMSSSEIDMGMKTSLQTLIENVMEATGRYLVNRPALIDIQRSVSQARLAQRQAKKDFKAVQKKGKFLIAGRILERFTNEILEERTYLAKEQIKPFVPLLQNISDILQSLFELAAKVHLSSLTQENMQLERYDNIVSSVRLAVPQWLLLFHDACHAVGSL